GYSFVKLLRLFLNGLINFSIKPLRIFFILGLFLEICSLIAIIIIIIQKLLDPGLAVGWASLSVMILFFSGLNLLAIGLVGEYIGRIILYQNRQTQYLIREKINFNKKDNFA
ncbi:MAG: sugar transferase, partial [Actinobacteria bacterium]|nr:sugar transferase [Actinomycetota bacterium]